MRFVGVVYNMLQHVTCYCYSMLQRLTHIQWEFGRPNSQSERCGKSWDKEHERDPGSANLKGSETNWNYAIAPKPSINLEKGSMSTPTFWFILVFLYFFNIYFLYFYNLIHYSSQGSASPRLIPAKQLTQQSVRIKYVRTCRELGRSVFVKNLVRSGFFMFFWGFLGVQREFQWMLEFNTKFDHRLTID